MPVGSAPQQPPNAFSTPQNSASGQASHPTAVLFRGSLTDLSSWASGMAVYTDFTDDELAGFWRVTTWARRFLQGHRRGHREFQLPAGDRAGPVHPDAVREAGERGRPAVLPRADGASGEAGIPCPVPVPGQGGQLRRFAGKPAALVTFLAACRMHRPQPRHCRALGQALARLHLAAAEFRDAPAPMLWARRLAAAVRSAAGRADSRARSRRLIEQELDDLAAGWPPTCRRASSTPTCFPTMFSSTAANWPELSTSTSPATTRSPTTSPLRERLVLRAGRQFNITKGRR